MSRKPRIAPTLADLGQDLPSGSTRIAGTRHRLAPRSRRATALLAFAGAAAMAGAIVTYDRVTDPALPIARITAAQAPTLDGDGSDAVWDTARSAMVLTRDGANLPFGESRVEVRALADADTLYLRFRWEDPTRSLKHLPLQKRADGWHLLHEQFDIEDEDAYYEDKLAVLLSDHADVAGGVTHLGQQPLAGMPKAFSGRGLHYTTDGRVLDMWHWKAVRGGLLGWMDDNHFGPPAEPKPEEIEGKVRYKAGYHADPGKFGAKLNFKSEPPGGYRGPVEPLRLPVDPAAVQARMGRIELDPASSTDAAWNMRESETAPYTPELDATIPVGTVIPGVLIVGEGAYEGDRGDVRASARWLDGAWTMEVARRLDTGSGVDMPFREGKPVYMWVSVFDHTQTRHTRHVQPVVLRLARLPAA